MEIIIKTACKLLTSVCNNQVVGGYNCPAGEHYNCPFKQQSTIFTNCNDITWKDWREYFEKKRGNVT